MCHTIYIVKEKAATPSNTASQKIADGLGDVTKTQPISDPAVLRDIIEDTTRSIFALLEGMNQVL
jgi:hypothetical protein